ncbi:hypothetical protein [Pectobacterium betavasculorum]|uniref:Acetone carboxylase subunit gamma n=1 Tax=Pectobacterium betavasculorum TaxID=55207 RepID=A0ABR4V0R6_9GAMM|nr:hypothetical protein [Pectobacterium betavasculorum]KFX20806.1 hypothetical protein JV35_06280 [Pectobacterium betavasculorum]
MSDSEDERERELGHRLHERLYHVSPELLSEFLFDAGVWTVKCMMCGSQNIGIPQVEIDAYEDGKTTYVNFVRIDAVSPRFSLINYRYQLICRSCGFVAELAVEPVLKWVEKRKGVFDGE